MDRSAHSIRPNSSVTTGRILDWTPRLLKSGLQRPSTQTPWLRIEVEQRRSLGREERYRSGSFLIETSIDPRACLARGLPHCREPQSWAWSMLDASQGEWHPTAYTHS